MEKRAAVLAIIVQDMESVAALNELLHQYGSYITKRDNNHSGIAEIIEKFML